MADVPRQLCQLELSARCKQINTGNVGELQLKWMWAMNEGGANEITPIVHDGIMFLGNTGNTIAGAGRQDRRAVVGKPHRSGAPAGPGLRRHCAASRLWGDKVYVATH